MMRKAAVSFLLSCMFYVAFALEQHATICKFDVQPSKSIIGATCYDITGTICFEHSLNDFRKAGDTIEKKYTLEISFLHGRQLVNANTGFIGHYYGYWDEVALIKNLKLLSGDITSYDFSFTIPVAAFDLATGTYTLTPDFKLTTGQDSHSILRKVKIGAVSISIPPSQKIRAWVKHISVDSLDAQGQLWDYFLSNPHDANPDIVWSLNYAGQTYFTSKMQRNTIEYTDDAKTQFFDIAISEGDTLNIQVKDIDDLTPDDIIGTIIIPSNTVDKNVIVTASSAQVKSLQYYLEVLK